MENNNNAPQNEEILIYCEILKILYQTTLAKINNLRINYLDYNEKYIKGLDICINIWYKQEKYNLGKILYNTNTYHIVMNNYKLLYINKNHIDNWDTKHFYNVNHINNFIKAGRESEGQYITRLCLNILFNTHFTTIRPDWLKNINGFNLELDCFNNELMLAIEYNGRQHYQYVPFFHKHINNFYDNIARDETKLQLCQSIGIQLIVIDYNFVGEEIVIELMKELYLKGFIERFYCDYWKDFPTEQQKKKDINYNVIDNENDKTKIILTTRI
jgi:hypothetical protein